MGSILTAMKYDSNGNLTQLTDDRGGDTSYAYDSHDRKTAATYHDGSAETFAFDLASDLIQYVNCNGFTFLNSWDVMGRKTDTNILPPTGGSVLGTTSQGFQYDGLRRMTLSADTSGSGLVACQFIRDSVGRTIEES